MRDFLSSKLLTGLMRATPEQMAAIELILKIPVLTHGHDGDATEPVEEDVARKAFALVSALDSEGIVRKAPVLTVFRFYCVEGLSAEETARKCRCSKATVINRLDMIRRKTGTEPDRLRTYSAQFERIEDELSDSRARRVYREEELGDGDGD